MGQHNGHSQSKGSADVDDPISYWHSVAFIVLSFGYMLPWTALGSLISYYKAEFGADFYVKIYCLYYLPGLPIAIIQYQYDESLDQKYGSANMYLWRGTLAYVSMVIVLLCMIWITDEAYLLWGFLFLGISGWLCHGTASMFAAMFPRSAIAYLQIGFRIPEVYSLFAVSILDLTSTADPTDLKWFHGLTAILVFFAMLVWISMVQSPTAEQYLASKDQLLRSGSFASTDSTHPGMHETDNLLHHHDNGDENGARNNKIQHASDANDFTLDTSAPSSEYKGDDYSHESNQPRRRRPSEDSVLEFENEADMGGVHVLTYLLPTFSLSWFGGGDDQTNCSGDDGGGGDCGGIEAPSPRSSGAGGSDKNKSNNNGSGGASVVPVSPYARIISLAELGGKDGTTPDHSSRQLQYKHRASRAQQLSLQQQQRCSIIPLCAALIITVWSSIFHAAFFAYVRGGRSGHMEQTLYFVRLFADLAGRPLTFLPRPWFLKTNQALLQLAMVRALLLVVFFVYVFSPSVPADSTFLLVFEAFFSLLAGYIAVLVYEYASRQCPTRAARAQSANTLNMGFQMAAFAAVVMSVAISTSLTMEENERNIS